MSKWMLYSKKADFNAIARELNISPVTARVIRNRDVIGAEATRRYLQGTMADLDDPESLPGLRDAAFVLRRKILSGAAIRVIGDYDVDGICSTYILWRLISFLGGKVSCAIPERIRDGYGINERLVLEAVADGVDTIVTCDNGIAAAEPLRLAKEAGLTVIVTDHHEIPYVEEAGGSVRRYDYPPADVIAEPWIPDEATGKPIARFPNICGAAVVYKLAMILLGKPDLTMPKTKDEPAVTALARELLGFAGIATVCDVMPLQDENRILVRWGLQEATNTDNIGLRSLILAAGLGKEPLTVYHAGFVIGPCLNASGRLDTAMRALALFQERDERQAMLMARDLKQLNDSRKSMTEEGRQKALQQVEEDIAAGRPLSDRRVLVVRVDDCHESLAGIIAGRLREYYQRPVIVLTKAEEAGLLKGSGRSVEAYDMFGEMNRCRDLFVKFGGHRMAAGLTIAEENAVQLDRRLNESCTLTEEEMAEVLHIDMELPPSFVTKDLARELELLEPCGTANPKALFVTRNLTLHRTAVFGKNRNVIRFDGLDAKGTQYDFVWFLPETELPDFLQSGSAVCNVVYEPKRSVWRGRESVQFVIKDIRRQI